MIRVPCPQTQLPTTRCSNPIIVGTAISRPPYLPLAFVGADDFCCGARNLCAALTAASNFDRCHSLLLAVSATGGAHKRPRPSENLTSMGKFSASTGVLDRNDFGTSNSKIVLGHRGRWPLRREACLLRRLCYCTLWERRGHTRHMAAAVDGTGRGCPVG